jgi:ElaB/YqjD/DUF883 family membrane-anchored ribosome-binding protein
MENRPGAPAPPLDESVNRAKSAAETALSDVKAAVKDEADTVKEKAMDVMSDAQAKAADQTRSAANTLRDTANRLGDGELPWMNTALNKTADGLERVTRALNTGDMKQTVDSLTQFARSHPALFLGLSVAAGFGLARVGKTAMEGGSHASDMQRPGAGQGLIDEAVAPYAPVSEV